MKGNKYQQSRGTEIGKKKFDRDHVDDDDDDNDGSESYAIDPSVELWRTVDFGRKKENPKRKLNQKSSEKDKITITAFGPDDKVKPKKSKGLATDEDFDTIDPQPSSSTIHSGDGLDYTINYNDTARKAQTSLVNDASKAIKENEELRKMIEAMKAQNQELAQKMEVEQMNAKKQIQNVLQDRDNFRQQMEGEKYQLTQKLLQSQEEADRNLREERDKFNKRLASMEQDKNALSERVRATEERSREDALTMLRLREEYGVGLQRMEEEKT
eukprot:gene14201-30218_t